MVYEHKKTKRAAKRIKVNWQFGQTIKNNGSFIYANCKFFIYITNNKKSLK